MAFAGINSALPVDSNSHKDLTVSKNSNNNNESVAECVGGTPIDTDSENVLINNALSNFISENFGSTTTSDIAAPANTITISNQKPVGQLCFPCEDGTTDNYENLALSAFVEEMPNCGNEYSYHTPVSFPQNIPISSNIMQDTIQNLQNIQQQESIVTVLRNTGSSNGLHMSRQHQADNEIVAIQNSTVSNPQFLCETERIADAGEANIMLNVTATVEASYSETKDEHIRMPSFVEKRDAKSLTPDKKVEIARLIRAIGIEQLKKTKTGTDSYCFGASYDTLMSINRDQKKVEFADLSNYYEYLSRKWRSRGRKTVVQNVHLDYARKFFKERPRGSIKKLIAGIARDLPDYPIPARTTLNHIILADSVCNSLRKKD